MCYVTLQELIVEQLLKLEQTANGMQRIKAECNFSEENSQSPMKSNYSLGNSPEVNKIGLASIALKNHNAVPNEVSSFGLDV